MTIAEQVWSVVDRCRPRALVDDTAFLRVLALTDYVTPIHRAVFECVLQGDGSKVDFSLVNVAPGALLLSKDALEMAGWRRVGALLAAAQIPGPLQDLRPTVDLEFDLGEIGVPPPSLFLGLKMRAERRWHSGETLAAAMHILGGYRASEILETYGRCETALPNGAFVRYVGFMLPRNTPLLRLVVAHLPYGDSLEYLTRIGWPGRIGGLAEIMDSCGRFMNDARPCFDIGGGVSATIGFECGVFSDDGDGCWRGVFDVLQRAGLCTCEEVRGALSWPGTTRIRHAEMGLQVERRINHVKLSQYHDGRLSAKVYLAWGVEATPA